MHSVCPGAPACAPPLRRCIRARSYSGEDGWASLAESIRREEGGAPRPPRRELRPPSPSDDGESPSWGPPGESRRRERGGGSGGGGGAAPRTRPPPSSSARPSLPPRLPPVWSADGPVPFGRPTSSAAVSRRPWAPAGRRVEGSGYDDDYDARRFGGRGAAPKLYAGGRELAGGDRRVAATRARASSAAGAGAPPGSPGYMDAGLLDLTGVARRLREKALRAEGLLLSGERATPRALPPRRDDLPRPPTRRDTQAAAAAAAAVGSRPPPDAARPRFPLSSAASASSSPPPSRKRAPPPPPAPEARLALPLPPVLPGSKQPFARLGLSLSCCAALAAAGLKSPTPIQGLALPPLLAGRSAAVLAETGSGKTLCYALPALTRFYARASLGRKASARSLPKAPGCACPEILFIVPSRELGLQVAAAAEEAADWCHPSPSSRLDGDDDDGYNGNGDSSARRSRAPPSPSSPPFPPPPPVRRACVVALLGRDKSTPPPAAAWEAADVLVATPGAAVRCVADGSLRLGRLRCVVVDEADELLGKGYAADTGRLLRVAAPPPPLQPPRASSAPQKPFGAAGDDGGGAGEAGGARGSQGQEVQLVFAAATLSRSDWDALLKPSVPPSANLLRIASPGLHLAPAALGGPTGRNAVVLVSSPETRAAALLACLEDDAASGAPGLPALVFASSTSEADDVAATLVEKGLPAAAFHGKLGSGIHRGELLDDLNSGELGVLVVTDAACRGLDLAAIRNVVQLRPAPSPAIHLHRVGRTGRACAVGPCQASVLVDAVEDARLGATPMLLRAHADGWDAIGAMVDTARREGGEA